jgi:hypothetical protein
MSYKLGYRFIWLKINIRTQNLCDNFDTAFLVQDDAYFSSIREMHYVYLDKMEKNIMAWHFLVTKQKHREIIYTSSQWT